MYAYASGLNYYSLFYTWSNGESGYNKNQISDLAPGTYSVTVSDGQSSCNYSQSFTLTDSKYYPVANAFSNITLCPGDSNGYVQSQLIQPYFPPHSYLWSNGETGSSISQVPAGIYTVTVTDRFGCTYADTAIVIAEAEVTIDSVSPETSTAGYPVTLSGHGFGRISEVYFNSLRAPLITSISDSILTVIVPENADTGNISIKTKNNCLVEGPYFNPTDKYGKLTVKVFYEGIYINGGYLNSPLINSGISGDALSTDLIQIELISASDLNRILSSSICTLNTRGVTEVKFSYALIGENVWIRIKGRNVMETWSKTPVILDEFCSFDFTTQGALQGVATLSIDSIQYTSALARIKIINPIKYSIITMCVCWGIVYD